MAGIQCVLERRLRTPHGQKDFQLVAIAARQRLAQLAQLEEQEALGEREVFLQQPITLKTATRDRQ